MSSRFIVQVVLTKEEKRELAKSAKAHGLSLSAYTRKVVTEPGLVRRVIASGRTVGAARRSKKAVRK